jgi:hypothetical protein
LRHRKPDGKKLLSSVALPQRHEAFFALGRKKKKTNNNSEKAQHLASTALMKQINQK